MSWIVIWKYMAKSCFRCHLNDFGENTFRGDHRSSGCSACHVSYNKDGLSEDSDPTLDKNFSPRPQKHQMTSTPPVDTCTTCHYRGARIGINFQGYRESAGSGHNPPHAVPLAENLHGHDLNFYLVDEDSRNNYDETPPDIHFEKGLICVDCHGIEDVHGDGHLPSEIGPRVKVQCEDCHGDANSKAQADPKRRLELRDDEIIFRRKKDDLEVIVPQVIDSITISHPKFSSFAQQGMGANERGFNHLDEIECSTCHSSWAPSCYGCHVSVDFTDVAASQTTSELSSGKPKGEREYIALFDQVLMRNKKGKIALSMPAERLTMTVIGPDPEKPGERTHLVTKRPRTFTKEDGSKMIGFGQRPVDPHTTRKTTTFMNCDRCHSVGSVDSPTNLPLLDLSHGFGSTRFPISLCDVSLTTPCSEENKKIYQLDAIQTRDGTPLVVPHPTQTSQSPLTLEEISRMRKVLVPSQTKQALLG